MLVNAAVRLPVHSLYKDEINVRPYSVGVYADSPSSVSYSELYRSAVLCLLSLVWYVESGWHVHYSTFTVCRVNISFVVVC